MGNIIRNKTKKILIITLISVVSQCFSTPVLGFDFNIGRISHIFEKESEQFIKKVISQVNKYENKNTNLIINVTKSGFSLLEKQTGLSENNDLFKAVKNKSLSALGMGFEAVREAKGLANAVFSSSVRMQMQPIYALNLGLKIKRDPKKALQTEINSVKKLANGGSNVLVGIAGAILNPELVFKGLSQSIRDTEAKIKNDPIKKGELQLKALVFTGSLFIGGGGVPKTILKAPEKASKGRIFTGSFFTQPVPVANAVPKSSAPLAIGNQIKTPQIKKTSSILSTPAVSSSKATTSSVAVTEFAHTEGLLYAFLKNRYYVGETINGVKVSAKNGDVLTLENGVVLFENAFHNEKVVHVLKLNLNKRSNGLWYLSTGEKADGTYIFVIDKNNKLHISLGDAHHSWLVDGAPVRYAGTFIFKDGKLIEWTNKSGHYLPYELNHLPKVADGVLSVEKIIQDFIQG